MGPWYQTAWWWRHDHAQTAFWSDNYLLAVPCISWENNFIQYYKWQIYSSANDIITTHACQRNNPVAALMKYILPVVAFHNTYTGSTGDDTIWMPLFTYNAVAASDMFTTTSIHNGINWCRQIHYCVAFKRILSKQYVCQIEWQTTLPNKKESRLCLYIISTMQYLVCFIASCAVV